MLVKSIQDIPRHLKICTNQRVPQLHGLVARSRNNLAIFGTEGATENVLLMTNKPASGYTLLDVPKTKSVIPGGGQCKLAVR